MKIQRALISVSDKTGLADFARELAGLGVELVSTGGTAQALREAGLAAREVAEATGFPEMLGGRVKTLHPAIHGGILFLRGNEEHESVLRQRGIAPIDLVCVNLYPFEAAVARPGAGEEDAVENMDIGGPAMLRSAAKNFASVTVVCDPSDYGRVVAEMKTGDGGTTAELRRELAQKAFARTAEYDAAIAAWLAGREEARGAEGPPLVLAYGRGLRLRYGENPHQDARFHRASSAEAACIAFAEVLHGKEMSYNNYVDGDAAVEAVKELSGEPAAAIVKHTNPCGYATGETLAMALEAAWAGDPVSAFGGVIAVTRMVDLASAQTLKGRFVEALIAPGFDPDAFEFLQAKSHDLRLLKLHRPLAAPVKTRELRPIQSGMLVQDRDADNVEQWVVVTEQMFPDEKRSLAEFGIKACKHVKSNAIVIVREHKPGHFALLGMGAGQPNRVDSVRKLAVTRARENIAELYKDASYGRPPRACEAEILNQSVLVSDAYFPFPDSIEYAAEAGIRYIVEPGGSKRDEQVIAACDQYGIALVFTGVRHFRH